MYIAKYPLTVRTPHTIATFDQLMLELESIRKTLISIDDEEYATGMTCVAVPLGRAPSQFAVGLSGPADRVRSNLEKYVALLRQVAGS
ncbi:IclR family transcriptional regulator domain-containing protein [Devosia sp. A449]